MQDESRRRFLKSTAGAACAATLAAYARQISCRRGLLLPRRRRLRKASSSICCATTFTLPREQQLAGFVLRAGHAAKKFETHTAGTSRTTSRAPELGVLQRRRMPAKLFQHGRVH